MNNTDSQIGGLISLPGNLESPRGAKASDWSGDYGSGPAGTSSGAMQLVKQTPHQMGAGRNSDSGDQTPSVWGQAGKNFPVGTSMGEGGMKSTAVKCDWSVSLDTGQTSPNAAMDDKY